MSSDAIMGPSAQFDVSRNGSFKQNTTFKSPQEITRAKRGKEAGAEGLTLGKFPSDLGIHFMSFNFRRARHGGRISPIQKTFAGTAFLPVASNLVDAVGINYNDAELGLVGGGIANFTQTVPGMQEIKDAVVGGAKDLADMSIAEVGSKVMEGAKSLMEKASGITATSFFDAAASQVENASLLFRTGQDGLAVGLNRRFGGIPNPNITALFRGVGLKNHSFEWKLAPRNEDETQNLFDIIHAFKHSALPSIGNGDLAQRSTMTFPDEVEIGIHGTTGTQKHHVEAMMMFKPCVIKNVTVNYTPDNTPSFFRESGFPTAVSLRLDLQETQIHTKEDYPAQGLFSGEFT